MTLLEKEVCIRFIEWSEMVSCAVTVMGVIVGGWRVVGEVKRGYNVYVVASLWTA